MAFSSIVMVLATFGSILESASRDVIELSYITNTGYLFGLEGTNGAFDPSFCIYKKFCNALKRSKTLARGPFEKKLKQKGHSREI